jgi:hypothetical protein
MTCVYMLADPRDQSPFYIGIGKLERPKEHFKKEGHNSGRWAIIRQLRSEGIATRHMIVYLARDVSSEVARYLEECLIDFLGRRSLGTGPLTNLTPGGEWSPMDDPVSRAKHAAAMRDPEWRRLQGVRLSARNRRRALHRRAEAEFYGRFKCVYPRRGIWWDERRERMVTLTANRIASAIARIEVRLEAHHGE